MCDWSLGTHKSMHSIWSLNGCDREREELVGFCTVGYHSRLKPKAEVIAHHHYQFKLQITAMTHHYRFKPPASSDMDLHCWFFGTHNHFLILKLRPGSQELHCRFHTNRQWWADSEGRFCSSARFKSIKFKLCNLSCRTRNCTRIIA
jgi:hypothetical protein